MSTTVGVSLPNTLFMELADFLRENDDPRDAPTVVQQCIRYWLDNANWKSELLEAPTEVRGFQWKEIFLPAGTQLRMKYKGKFFCAKVEGDFLMFDGRPTTPGAMVNGVTQSSRNAWRDLWVRRPNDQGWALAADLRESQ